MASAGYLASIIVTGSTAVTMTAEAMSGSGAGPYTISTATKDVWDPTATFTFYDNGVAISSADILSIDYLLGKVTFTASKTGPITVTGKYYVKYTVTDGSEISFELTRDVLDTTVFDPTTGGPRTRMMGLIDCSGTIHLKNRIDIDYNSGGNVRAFLTDLLDGNTFVLSMRPKGSGTAPVLRMWVYVTKGAQDLKIDQLVEGDVDFQLYSQTAASGFGVSVSYSDT